MDQLMLLKPTADYAEQIARYRQTFIMLGEPMEGTGSLYRLPDPEEWLEQVRDLSKPETVPEGWLPSSQFICVRPYDNCLVGMMQIRHALDEYMELFAGHVSFSVLPEDRNKGYGTWLLKNALPCCRDLGMERIIVVCDTRDAAGRRVIEKNNGVFLDTLHEPDDDYDVYRFRIELI